MRYLTGEILRLFKEEQKMAFVAGPRQVGKTTLIQHLLTLSGEAENYFNWDIDSHRKAIIRTPEEFWNQPLHPPASGQRLRLGLDEIHKYPRWKRFLKGLYDAKSKTTDILVTGSGRLDIYQKGGDSLFGRYALYRLHPFTLGELLSPERLPGPNPKTFWNHALENQNSKEKEEALAQLEKFTGFPEPLFAASDERLQRWRRAHHDLVIREDLRDLTRIREMGLIETLITLLPERVGAPLSLNSLREDVGVAFGSVRLWMEALSRLYFVFAIRPYAGKLNRTLRREEKVYLFDYSEIEDPGARFENMVALHLKKLCDRWNDWGLGDFGLFYVRDKEKKEVDFLITDHHKPYMLLETKLSDTSISPSLRYFKDRLKPAYAGQIVRHDKDGKLPSLKEGVPCLSAASFLSLI